MKRSGSRLTHPIHQDQRGITLVEMLVVVALVGLIAFGLTSVISQTFNVSSRTSNKMVAVRQVQQAGKEVSKDVLQSQNVTFNQSGDFYLNILWTDYTGVANNVTYVITPGGDLQRTHVISDSPVVRVVARYISSEGTNCAEGLDRKVVFKVTAVVGGDLHGATETRTYEIQPRPDA